MAFPAAIDCDMVGEYAALTKAGGGYFFDDVLEYRVWCYPARGAIDEADGSDYYFAFASYPEAVEWAETRAGASTPFVLVRQLEWVDEPQPGTYIHMRGERITEWRAEWLDRGARAPGAIEAFLLSRQA